jgi:hypothetical protein
VNNDVLYQQALENAALAALHDNGFIPEHTETRDLFAPGITTPAGKIELWVDVFPKNDLPLPPIVKIEPRQPTE